MIVKKATLYWKLEPPKAWIVRVEEPTQTVDVVDGDLTGLPSNCRSCDLYTAAMNDLEQVGYQLAKKISWTRLPSCDI